MSGHAYWLCNCRHPNTKVYYADEMGKLEADNAALRAAVREFNRSLQAEAEYLRTTIDAVLKSNA